MATDPPSTTIGELATQIAIESDADAKMRVKTSRHDRIEKLLEKFKAEIIDEAKYG
jgi:hypothetical protein